MTPRQIHNELLRLCHTPTGKKGGPFITTTKISAEQLAEVQRRLVALLEKIDYERTRRSFPGLYGESQRRTSYPTPMLSLDEMVRMVRPDLPSSFGVPIDGTSAEL